MMKLLHEAPTATRIGDNSTKRAAMLAYPDIQKVELMAQCERGYNFLHTGNTACLATASMNETWIAPSVLVDGLPSFNPNLVFILPNGDDTDVSLNIRKWPLDPKLNVPHLASKAAMMFHLGPEAWMVSKAYIFVTFFKKTQGVQWCADSQVPVYRRDG